VENDGNDLSDLILAVAIVATMLYCIGVFLVQLLG